MAWRCVSLSKRLKEIRFWTAYLLCHLSYIFCFFQVCNSTWFNAFQLWDDPIILICNLKDFFLTLTQITMLAKWNAVGACRVWCCSWWVWIIVSKYLTTCAYLSSMAKVFLLVSFKHCWSLTCVIQGWNLWHRQYFLLLQSLSICFILICLKMFVIFMFGTWSWFELSLLLLSDWNFVWVELFFFVNLL